MVARRPQRVNRAITLLGWLLALTLIAALPGPSNAKRRLQGEEFTEVSTGGAGEEPQSVQIGSFRYSLGPRAEQACLQDLLDGHLGLGTAADAILDGPAGLRVNLFSGHLVWQRTFLPHGMPRSRLALPVTFNSANAKPSGAPGPLPDGWSHGFGVGLRPAEWGVMEVVEHDGYVDRYFAVDEDQEVEKDELIEEILQARREGGVPPGHPIPGGRRFRNLLAEDGEFLDAMRARFIGGSARLAGTYLSQSRGHQVLVVAEDGTAVRTRSDGRRETFDDRGRRTRIETAAGPRLDVEWEDYRVLGAEIASGPALTFETGGGGQLSRVSGAEGRDVRFHYAHGRLVRIEAPEGAWSFEYDELGRILSVQGPRTWARVRYDGARVAALETPAGTFEMEYWIAGAVLGSRVTGPQGTVEAELDLEGRVRTLRDGLGDREVRFDGAFLRPTSFGTHEVEYDGAGHVVEISGPRGSLRVETDALDRPMRIVGLGGKGIDLEMDSSGLLARASDGAGRRASYSYDPRGLLIRASLGGETVSIDRNLWGEVERVKRPEGDTLYVGRDAAGRPTRFRRGAGRQMQLTWDRADRLIGLESADRHGVELIHGDVLRVVDPRSQVLSFGRDARGGLTSAEGTGVVERLSLHRAADGLVQRLTSSSGWDLSVEAEDGRVSGLRDSAWGEARFRYGGTGLTEARLGLTTWTYARETATGRPLRVTSSSGRDLGLQWDDSGSPVSLDRGGRPSFVVTLDRASRLSSVDPGTGTPSSVHRDPVGRVVEVHDGQRALLTLSRDRQGRVVAAGDGGGAWSCGFGLSNWPRQVDSPSGGTWSMTMDAAGRMTRIEAPGAVHADVSWTLGGDLHQVSGTMGVLALSYGVDGVVGRLEGASQSRSTHDGAPDLLAIQASDARGRVTRASAPDGTQLELVYGVDGLISRWRVSEEWETVHRDAIGRCIDPLPCADLGQVSPMLCGHRRSPFAHALLERFLPSPWAAARGGSASVIGPPLPRWAIDELRSSSDVGWTAAIPAPPGADLPVPDPEAGHPLTVAGVLALTGFLPDDLADHASVFPQGPARMWVRCPAADELRQLQETWLADPFLPGLTVVAAEPTGRGVSLRPEGPVVGHPAPWAAVEDPMGLAQPALEALGILSIAPAPAAVLPLWVPPVDRDPLASRLQGALDLGRWLSAPPRALTDRHVATEQTFAGGVSLWSSARVQAVVDGHGRLRGLDVGATATAMWNRELLDRFVAAAMAARPVRLPELGEPAPGQAPEAAVGLCPGLTPGFTP